MSYKPFNEWLNRLEDSLDRVMEMHYDFKTGEIVEDDKPQEEVPESFETQTYRYKIQKESGDEQTREIEAEGDSQALRRVVVQAFPGIEPPLDIKKGRDLLLTLRMNNVWPLVLWIRNMNTKKFVYDTEGRHYQNPSHNAPEL